MATMNEEIGEMKENAKHEFSGDFENLKSSFAQLRTDVSSLLSNALGAGKSGAGAMKTRAMHAVDGLKGRLGDLKERGADSMEVVEEKIEQNPLASALIAFAAGFVIAKIFTRK